MHRLPESSPVAVEQGVQGSDLMLHSLPFRAWFPLQRRNAWGMEGTESLWNPLGASVAPSAAVPCSNNQGGTSKRSAMDFYLTSFLFITGLSFSFLR